MGIQENRHTQCTGGDYSHLKRKDKQGHPSEIRAAREPYREQGQGLGFGAVRDREAKALVFGLERVIGVGAGECWWIPYSA
ncbi:hypothetical protein [Aeromonas phage 14AhydR10PP]|nr:hypothetical protein [Aeromonas phage 14AhydR10PP]